MAKLSKRAQVEALGWTFVAIPRFFAAGALWHDPATGQQSAEHWDHKRPDGWTAAPPPGFPASPRRFDNSSPNLAVRWAYEQAMAPRLQPDLGGVAALVALMGEARRAGVVADRTCARHRCQRSCRLGSRRRHSWPELDSGGGRSYGAAFAVHGSGGLRQWGNPLVAPWQMPAA